MPPDCFHQPLRLQQSLVIAEPQHRPAEPFKAPPAFGVPPLHLVQLVDSAVDLDHQPQSVAGEVGVEWPDGVFPAELVTVNPTSPQTFPDAVHRQPRGLAQGSCAIRAFARHG